MHVYTIEEQNGFYHPKVLLKDSKELTSEELVEYVQQNAPRKVIRLIRSNGSMHIISVDMKNYVIKKA